VYQQSRLRKKAVESVARRSTELIMKSFMIIKLQFCMAASKPIETYREIGVLELFCFAGC
jgi:hypothetical protein